MKKRVMLVLEVESEDEISMDDKFIRQDLEQEISCASNTYEVISFHTQKCEEVKQECSLLIFYGPRALTDISRLKSLPEEAHEQSAPES